MTTMVYKKNYIAPPIDKCEALRYAGAKEDDPTLIALIDECTTEAADILSYKLCYAEYPITSVENTVDFGFTSIESRSLSERLADCDSAIIFAATVGIGIDRLIAKYSRVSPSRALLLQGLGAERIEALCDLFVSELSQTGYSLTSRFSAGYGDLSLTYQREIFRALDCAKNIGLTLNESLLMSPTKSVTAIIGVKRGKL